MFVLLVCNVCFRCFAQLREHWKCYVWISEHFFSSSLCIDVQMYILIDEYPDVWASTSFSCWAVQKCLFYLYAFGISKSQHHHNIRTSTPKKIDLSSRTNKSHEFQLEEKKNSASILFCLEFRSFSLSFSLSCTCSISWLHLSFCMIQGEEKNN